MYIRHSKHQSARITIMLVFTAVAILFSVLMPIYFTYLALAGV